MTTQLRPAGGAGEPGAVTLPGFTDAHTHLLRDSAGIPFPWEGSTVGAFHHAVAATGATPADVPEPAPPQPLARMAARLRAGLAQAARAGLVEVTEMGMRSWWYLDALDLLQQAGPLPARVRVYLASGLAEQASRAQLAARRAQAGPWVSLDGVKFYADGWLGPRTCAMCLPFTDQDGSGLLFLDGPALARRIGPFAAQGWRIATHAIGDRAVGAVLDAYELTWDGDPGAVAAAAPRIEHASVQSRELMARLAESGVTACIQPSFAVTDAEMIRQALGPDRAATAYPWRGLATAGARLLAGSDYPIEVIEPLAGLARLVSGRSQRTGWQTPASAPPGSRLGVATALSLMTDAAAGHTLLSADPRAVPAAEIDLIEVRGTLPRPFRSGS